MKYLMLVLGLWALPAFAAESTVTLRSGSCEDAANAMASKGLAFTRAGKTYVVTSHHRVYNAKEDQGVCHWVDRGARATLLAWDWGSGLALFEAPVAGAPALPVSASSIARDVMLSGAPERGRVISPDAGSDRHFVPLLASGRIQDVVTLKVSPAEIGSPVYSAQGGEWQGLVSHLYVGENGGQGSTIDTWDYDLAHVESHVLMISRADVIAFVNRYFAAPATWKAVATASFEDQRDGRSRVKVGGLFFEEECGPSEDLFADVEALNSQGCAQPSQGGTALAPLAPVGGGAGGGHGIGGGAGGGHGIGGGAGGGHGIGGGPGTARPRSGGSIGSGCGSAVTTRSALDGRVRGVGGGQGWPIGGTSEAASCRVRVYRNEFGGWQGYDLTLWSQRAQSLFTRLKTTLANGGSAVLPFAYRKTPQDAHVGHAYYNLQYFFRQLEIPERKDVILYDAAARARLPADPLRENLRTAVADLLKILPKRHHLVTTQESAINIVVRLPLVLTLLGSESRKDVATKHLDEFIVDPQVRSDWWYYLPIVLARTCTGPCVQLEPLELWMSKLRSIRAQL